MYRFALGLSRIMAILGGIVLSILVLMTCASVLGRTINTVLYSDLLQTVAGGFSNWLLELGIGPIKGDFELVEAGVAFAIFAFIPLTQITSGHASVDIFTSWLPKRAQRILGATIEVLFAIVLVVIAMQLKEGMDSKLRSGQTTFLLQYPIWWAYAASLVGAVIAALVGVYMAFVRISEALTGQAIADDPAGEAH